MPDNDILAQLKILIDISNRKHELLTNIQNVTENQYSVLDIAGANALSTPEYIGMIDAKQQAIDIVKVLDDSFADIYTRIQPDLSRYAAAEGQSTLKKHKTALDPGRLPEPRRSILTLQNIIRNVSDLDIKIKISEEKNRRTLSLLNTGKRPVVLTPPDKADVLAKYAKQKKLSQN